MSLNEFEIDEFTGAIVVSNDEIDKMVSENAAELNLKSVAKKRHFKEIAVERIAVQKLRQIDDLKVEDVVIREYDNRF